MIKFIKTCDGTEFEKSNVEMTMESNELTLDEIFTEFQGFLQACGFGFKLNEHIDVVDDGDEDGNYDADDDDNCEGECENCENLADCEAQFGDDDMNDDCDPNKCAECDERFDCDVYNDLDELEEELESNEMLNSDFWDGIAEKYRKNKNIIELNLNPEEIEDLKNIADDQAISLNDLITELLRLAIDVDSCKKD